LEQSAPEETDMLLTLLSSLLPSWLIFLCAFAYLLAVLIALAMWVGARAGEA